VARVLAVVPARGGSKRFVNKNISVLAGKTLIDYALDCASHCGDITDIVCASDSKKILQYANKHFLNSLARATNHTVELPASLTLDNSLLMPVIRYCLEHIESGCSNGKIDTVVLLQPTSPFRLETDLSQAISLHNQFARDVVSVSRIPTTLEKLLYVDEFGLVSKVTPQDNQLAQLGTSVFRQNGAIYVVARQRIYNTDVWVDSDCIAYEMPTERSIDIDTEADLLLAEMMLREGLVQ
jgi:CMP-N-acetylneuraminic acid synthetase